MTSASIRGALLALITLCAAPAAAYIPPASFILGKAADKRATIATSDFELNLETSWADSESGEPSDDKLMLKRPLRMRWVRPTADGGERVTIAREGELAEITPTGEVSRAKLPFEPLSELLVPRAQTQEGIRAEYLAICQKLGIDTQVVSLARFANRVAFVLGASAKDRDKNQLWIDKDSFAPVRVLYRGEHRGAQGMWDVQLREFGARETGDAIPRVIERAFDGKLVSHSEVQKLSTAKLSDAVFSVPTSTKK